MNADLLNLDSASCPRPSGRQVLFIVTIGDNNANFSSTFDMNVLTDITWHYTLNYKDLKLNLLD